MTYDPTNASCEDFQSRMPELIDSGEDASVHPHLRTCARCRTLFHDLESIAQAARDLLPAEDPPDTLWEKLDSAIKAGGAGHPRGC